MLRLGRLINHGVDGLHIRDIEGYRHRFLSCHIGPWKSKGTFMDVAQNSVSTFDAHLTVHSQGLGIEMCYFLLFRSSFIFVATTKGSDLSNQSLSV